MGGHWGPELKFAGYDQVIIQGAAAKPTYIWIDDDTVEIRDASHIWGKDRYEAEEIVREEIGDDDIRIMSIGPGGEKLVWFANIMNDLTNSAGRTGGGAVMGSKKLKLIAVRGTKGVKVADPDKAMELSDYITSFVMKDPGYQLVADRGTPNLFDFVGMLGMAPRKNWQECGMWDKQEAIHGRTIEKDYQVSRSACFNCFIHCHCLYRVKEGEHEGVIGGGPEYETLCALGNKCLCADLPAILHMNTLCNKYGLDTVSTGNNIALLMDLYERKIITKKDTDGIAMAWGDTKAMEAIIHKIARGEGIGKKLAVDSFEFARKLGRGAEKRVMGHKGLTITGVEVRSSIGAALSHCLSPRGSHHLSGIPTVEWVPNPEIAERICGHPEGADTMSYHPQAKARSVKYYEDLFTIVDSLGVCKFTFGHSPFWHGSKEGIDAMEQCIVDCIEAVTGEKYSWEELMVIADRVYNIERVSINNQGMTRKDDEPSFRDSTEECPGEHPVGLSPLPPIDKKKFDKMLDAYYDLRGWDKEGRPTESTLERLGIHVSPQPPKKRKGRKG
jgi:aldehyde:ferredoxin oxidoreductase